MINVSKFVESLEGKPVAVLGLGISNTAAIKALVKAGATVAAWDDSAAHHENAGEHLVDLTEQDMAQYACLIVAPAIPLELPDPHPIVKKAKEAGLEIMCDLEILGRCDHGRKTIGITGTNGKSTTTALIGHILNECGIKAQVGGNIGKAALDLTMPPKDGAFVLEISSFQLDLCTSFAPDIGVWLNLTQDHLDRHGSMEGYAEAKARIFRGMGAAVISTDDDWSKKTFDMIEKLDTRDCYPISVHSDTKDGIYVEGGKLYEAMFGEPVEIAELDIKTLPGIHNQQNICAAYAVARLMGLEPEAIMAAMETFAGLQHRQYLTRTINGVAYVNDSKATNAAAAGRALASYKNIYWIVGGRPKEGGLNGLEPYVDRIRHAFLIGEAMDEFATWLDNHGVPHNFSHTLGKAAHEAHRMAQEARGEPGGTGVVLLSPACASFDQYSSFEERGDHFTTHVENLEEVPL